MSQTSQTQTIAQRCRRLVAEALRGKQEEESKKQTLEKQDIFVFVFVFF